MSVQTESWNSMLPQGITVHTLYVYGAAFLVFAATMIVGKSITDKGTTRLKVKEKNHDSGREQFGRRR